MSILELFLTITAGILILELLSQATVNFCRNKFQWLITQKKDETPKIDKKKIKKKYFEKGFDSELGWVRKPNTTGYDKRFFQFNDNKWGYKKSKWTINRFGARLNPGHEKLKKSMISCYGDSFTFSRQVNDNETWEYQLSKKTGFNVLNFGVGNYGLDQALLRLQREFPKNPTKIVIMAVVPDTISRILSCWKHFYEYGNIWAFKPRFKLNNFGNLQIIPNIIDKPEKFFKLKQYMDRLRKQDFFYKKKFKKEIIQFPYLFFLMKNPIRNLKIIFGVIKHTFLSNFFKKYKIMEPSDWHITKFIRKTNLRWTVKLYKDPQAVKLIEKLIDKFLKESKKFNFKPIFIFLPQKNEVLYYKNKGKFYMPFFKKISRKIETIDITTPLLHHPNLNSLYSEPTIYGAHYSKKGNAFVGNIIYQKLKEKGYLN